jgi:hypothetical protein
MHKHLKEIKLLTENIPKILYQKLVCLIKDIAWKKVVKCTLSVLMLALG